MKLGELLNVLEHGASLAPVEREREVLDIAQDSRKVKPGSLFVAVRGFHSDGHRFIPQALQQGAMAVIAEERNNVQAPSDVPLVIVNNSRRALALLSDVFYGHPSRHLKLIGITGTKGKTTTSYLVRSIIETAGHPTGLIGTIDYRIGDKIYPAPNTTPESLDLQRLLGEMVDAGAEYCVMEVSSHALALGRTEGCVFETAVFTNLAQDHLDFHKDMESYFQAKLLLFIDLAPMKSAVVNIDDSSAQEIMRHTKATVYTVGLQERADIHPAGAVSHSINGLAFSIITPEGTLFVESPLMGEHNIYNILSAVGVGLSLGIDRDAITRGIKTMKAVPGRMEKVDEGQPFVVVVDYAHTEDSLKALLGSLGPVTRGRIITLFGCGGDRDRTKRPKMGAAALAGSDIVIVTTDNPRTEDPFRIIEEIEAGMQGTRIQFPGDALPKTVSGKKTFMVVPDRREAIGIAVRMAWPGDTVVLAGKGHETYQIIGETKIHFDDREIARDALRMRRVAN